MRAVLDGKLPPEGDLPLVSDERLRELAHHEPHRARNAEPVA
jgi:hypothetical protein